MVAHNADSANGKVSSDTSTTTTPLTDTKLNGTASKHNSRPYHIPQPSHNVRHNDTQTDINNNKDITTTSKHPQSIINHNPYNTIQLSQADYVPAHQYTSVSDFVKSKGGSHVITRVLIANNGIAAVKAIRSVRRWSYDTFGNERMVQFIVMATPDDLKANAAYIHLADEFVPVPAGSNNNNYSNVSLIVDIAERTNAHAVWPGWGHASENPKLPDALAKTKNRCIWIGPPSSAMRALGDKIGSTIIAQAAGVPCMGWSGDGLTVNYKTDGMPKDLYVKACIKTAQQAREQTERIGLPVMIKASEGGGGKGIRKVEHMSNIDSAFQQVQGEVPGSPIFIMKLAPECRHLEAQLLADQHGDAIAIFGRDCSIQRRHQKIIEEGPVAAAPADVWRQMELSAIRLAKEVGYVGAGTVEYLYTTSGEYYFLELNPRLQVEHPVTELVSGVNLPACQLMVAMGIPLYKIRGVRRMFDQPPDTDTPINFETTPAKTVGNHIIACRITAENPDAQFQPTSGTIQELNFRSSPDVWGYFSVAARGGVHEFSDSQFGHVFAQGATRELARRAMALALKELSIRGDIRTTVEYLQQILETPDFKSNNLSTTWLEKMMHGGQITMKKPLVHLTVMLGALFRSFRSFTTKHTDYMAILERGQLPSSEQHNALVRHSGDLIYEQTKYTFSVSKCGSNLYNIAINEWNVMTEVHTLTDDGLLVLLDGKKHVVYGQEFASGLRLTVDGKTCLFQQEYDPTQLRASMQGKLVRYVCKNNTHVEKNKPYAEVEVMKMILALHAPESGVMHHVKPEQSVLEAGELIGTLTLDHPEMVQKSEPFTGQFPQMGTPHRTGDNSAFILQDSLIQLTNCLNGYYLPPVAMETAVTSLMSALRNPALPLDQVNDVLSTLIGRIPEQLYDQVESIINEYKHHIHENRFYWESPIQFPSLEIGAAIDQAKLQCQTDEDRASLELRIQSFSVLIQRYSDGNHTYAINILTQLLQQYVNIEQYFNNDLPLDTVLRNLKKEYKNDLQQLATVASAHYQLSVRNNLVVMLLKIIENQLTPLLGHFTSILHELATLVNKEYASVALKARQLIMKQQMPSTEQRRIAISTILSAAASVSNELHADRLAPLIDQSQPIEDLIFQFFGSNTRPAIQAVAVEAYIRRTYQVFNITDVNVSIGNQRSNSNPNAALPPAYTSKNIIKARWEFLHQPLLGSSSSVLAQSHVAQQSNTTYLMSKAHSYGNFGILVGQRQQSTGVLYDNADGDNSNSNDWATSPSPVDKRQQSSTPNSRSAQPTRVGIMVFFTDFDSVKKEFNNVLAELDGYDVESPSINGQHQEPPHVIYIGIRWNTLQQSSSTRVPADELLAQMFRAFVQGYETQLTSRGVRRVTFIITPDKQEYPAYFTFRSRLNFDEDTLIRHIEPSYAHYMQLQRFANFDIQSHPTNNRMVHVFAAYPSKQPGKGLALPPTTAGSKRLSNADESTPRGGASQQYDGRRFFVRSLIRKLDSADLYETADIDDLDLDAHPETEVAFVEALSALEISIGGESKRWRNNSIFLNMLVEASMSVEYIEAVIKLLARRYDNKLRRLNVGQVELSVSVRHVHTDADTEGSADDKTLFDQHGYAVTHFRFVCTNPTGYILNVDTYEEVESPESHKIVFKYSKPPKQSQRISAIERGVWNGHETTTAYPVTTKSQAKRMVAESLDTVYVYDWLVLIEAAIERSWRIAARSPNESQRRRTRTSSLDASNITLRNVREETDAEQANVPEKLIEVTELIVKKRDNITRAATNTGLYELVEAKRDAGQNDVGMVGWKITMYTPQYPHGRDVVFIANDITFQAGTFGPMEDVVFDLCSKYARQRCIPRIYLAANSGARIGLAEELRHKFQIAWIDNDVQRGVDYLYLNEADYKELSKSVIAVPVDVKQKDTTVKRYVIKDIVGAKDGLGVENLRGSGTIAGETSLAYNEIFTLTYVTSRTVGIGAYLARLGQRCIQKQTPAIILTGFNALNKLLGRTVYTSNVQLGGIDIMYTNGVSHMVVENDMRGIQQTLAWLAYVPDKRNTLLPITPVNQLYDTIDRSVDYCPMKSTPYDPRNLLTGCMNTETNTWQSGLFDRGSFTELLGGWARSVVTGRGRIGNMPVGVIAVETRTIEQLTPADPAATDSKEQVRQLAGQVWFPDSAYKTAQCIWDCNCEDLPLIILANWRGFSGGMKDMFDQVLKFGAYIVDALRTYKQPVLVYLPPFSTLRGGAWVVVDPTINAAMMEMFADESARGGVLETDGTLEVKYRKHEILATMHRCDEKLMQLDNELKQAESTGGRPADADGKQSNRSVSVIKRDIKERETHILPLFTTAATLFADKHDTPGRMQAKGCISGVIEWKDARTRFYWRLRRRMREINIVKQICSANGVQFNTADDTYWSVLDNIKQIVGDDKVWSNDRAVSVWYDDHSSQIDKHVASLRQAQLVSQMQLIVQAAEQSGSLASGLSGLMKTLSKEQQTALKNAISKC